MEPKTKGYIIASLRKIFRWSRGYRECRKSAERKFEEGTYYQCAQCEKLFGRSETQVDHIKPVIDIKKGWEDWDVYITRLFVPNTKLQLLCKACHKLKTRGENAKRRKHKQKRLSGI